MAKEPRITAHALRVMGAIMNASSGEMSGVDISKQSGMMSGTMYPLLLRLEDAGLLRSRWETDDPHVLGRPRRRYYSVTGLGATRARAAAKEMAAVAGGLAWA